MRQQFPIDIQMQLIETLCLVFYYKQPLYTFLRGLNVPQQIFLESQKLIESETKRKGLNFLIDSLLELPNGEGLGPLRRMLDQLRNWTIFNAAENPEAAKKSVQDLAALIKQHDQTTTTNQEETERIKQLRQEQAQKRAMSERLSQQEILRDRFVALFSANNPQQRGRDLEKILHDLFKFEELNPDEAFVLQGEQIDGAFEIDGTHYLVEAKWLEQKTGPDKIAWFKEKLARKFRPVGLMIAINEFTDEAIRTAQDSKCIILMNGDDLMQVLEPTVDLDLKTLLRKKIAAFSRRGTPFITAREIINGKI
jgi:hypothetical protein